MFLPALPLGFCHLTPVGRVWSGSRGCSGHLLCLSRRRSRLRLRLRSRRRLRRPWPVATAGHPRRGDDAGTPAATPTGRHCTRQGSCSCLSRRRPSICRPHRRRCSRRHRPVRHPCRAVDVPAASSATRGPNGRCGLGHPWRDTPAVRHPRRGDVAALTPADRCCACQGCCSRRGRRRSAFRRPPMVKMELNSGL